MRILLWHQDIFKGSQSCRHIDFAAQSTVACRSVPLPVGMESSSLTDPTLVGCQRRVQVTSLSNAIEVNAGRSASAIALNAETLNADTHPPAQL